MRVTLTITAIALFRSTTAAQQQPPVTLFHPENVETITAKADWR